MNKDITVKNESLVSFPYAMSKVFPNGLSTCDVLGINVEGKIYRKGVVVFKDNLDAKLFLEYIAVYMDGGRIVVHYLVTSGFSEVVEAWE